MTRLLFMPHGACYLWRSDLIALHVFGDLQIALAYFAIPLLLIWRLALGPVPAHVRPLVVWFAAFILLCGLTHIAEVITIWTPMYYSSGLLKVVTALVSIRAGLLLLGLARHYEVMIERSKDYETVRGVLFTLRERQAP